MNQGGEPMTQKGRDLELFAPRLQKSQIFGAHSLHSMLTKARVLTRHAVHVAVEN